MYSQLLFAIGASGVGKTTALQALAARELPQLACYHFDAIGVPSVDAMVTTYGTPERWQEASTHAWIARLRLESRPVVILEGQTRPSFIRTGLRGTPAGIVLLDCQPEVRSDRLRTHRRQSELDTPEMHSWASYLRGQADALGLPVIDTTSRTPDAVADDLLGLAQTVSAWAAA